MKRTTHLLFVVLAGGALLLSACGGAAAPKEEFVSPSVGGLPSADFAGEALGERGLDANGVGGAPASSERLVIQNATLSIVVDDPKQSMSSIAALAEDLGGFVVSSNLYQTTLASGIEVPAASITIRVPVEDLEQTLQTIEGSAKTVLSRNQNGQDVTAEYTDLRSRLRNLEDAEVLLRQIMDEATDTEAILAAFNQLNYITEQIEVLKGQIQYYEEASAMSAISVDLTASQAVQPITIGGWEPVGVARDAIQALINALQSIANVLIWLALYVLPVVAIIGLPVWLIVRGLRCRRSGASKRKA